MKFTTFVLSVTIFFLSVSAQSSVITLDPTSDGSLYTCEGCNTVSDGAYVLASGYIQGAVKFSTEKITGNISQALLSLNPYGLPLWGKSVDIYGYGSSIGELTASDSNAGSFLGTLLLPDDLGYGQDAYFDVTSFVSSIQAPFIAFNLRSDGTDVFSSLEYNYGHPSQLTITTSVPEPSSLLLMLAGLGIVVARSRVKFQK